MARYVGKRIVPKHCGYWDKTKAYEMEDAEYVKKQVEERFGIHKFIMNTISPTIGAHSGPGTVTLFFMGESR